MSIHLAVILTEKGEFCWLAQIERSDFVYNPQEIAARIKNTASGKGIALKTLLSECGLGINTVSKIAAGTDILTLNFVKIADRLDVSVDFLLGRTDIPEVNR